MFWSNFGHFWVIFKNFQFLNVSIISQFLKYFSISQIWVHLFWRYHWFIFNLFGHFSQQILTISNCGQFFCQILVNSTANFWSTFGQRLVNVWSTFGQLSVNFWSTFGQLSVKFWSFFGQLILLLFASQQCWRFQALIFHILTISIFWSNFGQVLVNLPPNVQRFEAFSFSPQKWSKIEEEEKVAYFSQFPSFSFKDF